MAGGNKLEILMKIKVDESPLNKIRSKMQSLLPTANKVESKLSNLTKRMKITGAVKLNSALSRIIPVVNRISNSFNNIKNRMRTAFNNNAAINKLRSGLAKIGTFTNKLKTSFSALKSRIATSFPVQALNKFKNGLGQVKKGVDKIISSFKSLFSLKGMIAGMVAGAGAVKTAKTVDNNALRNARLGMVSNDVPGLKQQTLKASLESGADYNSQLDQIARLKMLTNGLFDDTEAVKFTSTLDKAFKLSGTAPEEAAGAMYQLNQAMVSGKLQGDEFRSVMEGAPMLAQMMADSIGVSVGELRELSSDGKLTSDIIKKAVLGNADEISAKYGKMPLTFNKVWQNMKSMGQYAMDGLLTKVNELLNTPAGQKMAQDLQQGAVVLAKMANSGFDGMLKIFSKLDFKPLLEPLSGIGEIFSQAFSGVSGDGVINTISGIINSVISVAGSVVGVFQNIFSGMDFGKIGQIFGDIGNAIGTLFSTIDFGMLGNAFSTVFNAIIQAISVITPHLTPVMAMIGTIVNLVYQIIPAVMPIVSAIIQFGSVLLAILIPAIQFVVNIFAAGISVIIMIFHGIVAAVSSVMMIIIGIVQGAISGIATIFSLIVSVVQAVLAIVVGIFTSDFSAVQNIVKGAIDKIVGFFNRIVSKAKEIGGAIKSAFNIQPPAWLSKGIGTVGNFIKGKYTGARSWEGGPVRIAEKGAEMVTLPGGKSFLAGQETVVDLPQGTRIDTAESTRKMIEKGMGKIQKTDGRVQKSEKNSDSKSKNYVFSPNVNIYIDTAKENIESKIKKVFREIFEEQIISIGG